MKLLHLLTGAAVVPMLLAQDYGADCSFPIHYKEFRCGDQLGDRASVYEEYMQGCRDKFGSKGSRCDSNERDRLAMSLRQPQSMVNYTSTGFKKIKAPAEVRRLLTEHWERNKDKKEQENWGIGNIYTNNWASPTYMVSVENTRLRGGGTKLKDKIWNAAKSTIEEWTGMELKQTSMYGIRIYTEGAILSPHVDRLPLVSSCIVNVAQDVDEPWPLEVYDREGRAVNVTMEPGDMVLYESGSLIHGRPFPLKGRYFANIFIHFEPTGRPLNDNTGAWLDALDDFYPPYLLENSPELPNWRRWNPHGWKETSPSAAFVDTRPEGNKAAAVGDVDSLMALASKDKGIFHVEDENGWTVLHEAARGGHANVVRLLVQNGVDVNARTQGGKGATALNIAIRSLSEKHPVSRYLKSLGAVDIGYGEL